MSSSRLRLSMQGLFIVCAGNSARMISIKSCKVGPCDPSRAKPPRVLHTSFSSRIYARVSRAYRAASRPPCLVIR